MTDKPDVVLPPSAILITEGFGAGMYLIPEGDVPPGMIRVYLNPRKVPRRLSRRRKGKAKRRGQK